MTFNFKSALFGSLLLISLGALLSFLVFNKPEERKQSILGRPETEINTDRAAVIKEIQSLNRLETASYSIEKVIEAGTKGNTFQELIYGDRVLLIAHGKVIAGIDLALIRDRDVVVSGDSLSIITPAPSILSVSLDNSKTSVYDRKLGVLSKGNKDLEAEARQAAEQSILQAACTSNILDEAGKNAEDRLRQTFSLAGFTRVTVTVPQGTCPTT